MLFAPAIRSAALASPRSFDRGFERFVNDAFFPAARGVQVESTEQGWTLNLDVPGIAREDLGVGIEGQVVRIETRAEAKRQYKAAYELPQEIDAGASEAKLENGVLTLKLARLAPVSKVTQLSIA